MLPTLVLCRQELVKLTFGVFEDATLELKLLIELVTLVPVVSNEFMFL